MVSPTLFYDPTSEPSRAVHWFCLEANIPHELHYIWLARSEHLSEDFLAVNPFHKVPALQHGDFCLSEATAIMQYLAELNDSDSTWFGANIEQRAIVNKLLSWYHTNLRQILTLDYFIPVLLMPAYLGIAPPNAVEVSAKIAALHVMLAEFASLLADNSYLAGAEVSALDILFAAELCALKIDLKCSEILEQYTNITAWLAAMQTLPHYRESHKVWDAVVPLIARELQPPEGILNAVTLACEQALL
jgi:glutathione S-transferase